MIKQEGDSSEMKTFDEFNTTRRENVEKAHSYFIPFERDDEFAFNNKIIDRTKSSLFISLDGMWNIKEHGSVDDVVIDEELSNKVPVPSCVQMFGYDHIQYINYRYPFPFRPPFTPKENPAYHYRRDFDIEDLNYRYYLNFEGVDSFFDLFIHGKKVGYSQISHSTSEFDITS